MTYLEGAAQFDGVRVFNDVNSEIIRMEEILENGTRRSSVGAS